MRQVAVDEFTGVVAKSLLGLAFFLATHGLGFAVAGYGYYCARKLRSAGNKKGEAAVFISGATLAFICLGWFLRLNGFSI